MFSSRFMLFPTLKKKKIGVKKIKIPGGGGGGGGCGFFFVEKQFFLISRFMLFSTLKKVPLHLLVKWEVFLQIVERDSWDSCNLYTLYPLFPCSDFVSQMWGGGGVMFFSHFMLFPTFLENKIWEYKTIISHLMFSSCFLCMLKYCKVPLHLQLLVKWEVVSPNSRYREFYHEIGNIEKFPFTYWLNGRRFLQIVDIHVGNFDMKLTGRWFPR